MAITQDVVVLNDFGAMRVEQRSRTTSSGTTDRYTVTMTATPILHDFAAAKLSRAVPDAIAALLKRQIAEIAEKVSEATLQKRGYAKAAFDRGAAWAKKRYSGGRTGAMPPESASEDRMFNDSGRLAASIVAMQNVEEEGFTINVAANRLTPETFQGGAFQRMIERLRDLAPAFKGGIEVLQDPLVKDAIETAKAEWIIATVRSGQKQSGAALELLKKYGWQYIGKPILLG